MLPMMEIVLPQAPNNVPAFLAKLWKMVDDPDTNHLISWSEEGNSFIIHNQNDFSQALLPYYYKHSNMASFVRQLNMYGFHKVVGVDSGGLKSEKQEEMEFAHPYFLHGMENLLDKIKRKVSSTKAAAQFTPLMKTERVSEVLTEVTLIKDKQEDLDTKLDTMKKENEALWREVVNLRQKHQAQQKIVNKLIEFLVRMVQPRIGGQAAVKRRYGANQLAIEGMASSSTSGPSTASMMGAGSLAADYQHGGKEPRLDLTMDDIDIGPIISDVTQDEDLGAASMFDRDTGNVEMPTSPDPEDWNLKPFRSPSAMQAVNPSLVNPAISVLNRQQPNLSTTSPTRRKATPSRIAMPGSNPMVVSQARPVLNRELSREDFDKETSVMQKDLDNLRDLLSGQVTLDSNIITSLFSPEEPLANLFFSTAGSNSNTGMPQELPRLQMEAGANGGLQKPSNSEYMMAPYLFEQEDESERTPLDSDQVDDFGVLHTPLVFNDTSDPLLTPLKK